MKKIVIFIICLLVITCAVSLAEDMSSMSISELLDLHKRVCEEILNKDALSDILLYPGEYVVGDDLDPGEYIIQCIETFPRDVARAWKYESRENDIDPIETPWLAVGEIYRIVFEDRNMFKLENGIYTLIKRF